MFLPYAFLSAYGRVEDDEGLLCRCCLGERGRRQGWRGRLLMQSGLLFQILLAHALSVCTLAVEDGEGCYAGTAGREANGGAGTSAG